VTCGDNALLVEMVLPRLKATGGIRPTGGVGDVGKHNPRDGCVLRTKTDGEKKGGRYIFSAHRQLSVASRPLNTPAYSNPDHSLRQIPRLTIDQSYFSDVHGLRVDKGGEAFKLSQL
jgi:hypothetical protein